MLGQEAPILTALVSADTRSVDALQQTMIAAVAALYGTDSTAECTHCLEKPSSHMYVDDNYNLIVYFQLP